MPMSEIGGSGGPHPPLRGTLRLARSLRAGSSPPPSGRRRLFAYQRPFGRDALNDVGRVLTRPAA